MDRMSGFGSDTYIEMGSFVLTESKANFYLIFSSLPPVTPRQFVAVLVSSVIFAGFYLLLNVCFTDEYRFIVNISPSFILAYLVVINVAELQLEINKEFSRLCPEQLEFQSGCQPCLTITGATTRS